MTYKTAEGKIEWLKVKREYVTSDISLKNLAKKVDVSFHTLKTHSVNEEWGKCRREYREKLEEKTTSKTIEKISENNADTELEIAELKTKIRELAFKRIYKDLSDPKLDSQNARRAVQNFKDMCEIEPNGVGEQYEDDGLLDALADKIEDVFIDGDDAEMVGGA